MGVMLANPCHPYIQRGYHPFVIPNSAVYATQESSLSKAEVTESGYYGLVSLQIVPWHKNYYIGIVSEEMCLYGTNQDKML